MTVQTYYLANPEKTVEFGQLLAKCLPSKGLIFLQGNLGAGKTTLIGSVIKAMGHKGSTKSPTYTIVEPYLINSENRQKIYHFDLYRLADPEELEYIGIRDYIDEDALCFVEWPDKGKGFLPLPDMIISLEYQNEARKIALEVITQKWLSEFRQLDKFDKPSEQAIN